MFSRACRRLHKINWQVSGPSTDTTQSLVHFCPRRECLARRLTTASSSSSSFESNSALPESRSSPKADKTSIFSDKESPWDHVFDNIQTTQPFSATLRNPLSGVPRRLRRQKMTAREISAFDDMFNMIFDAVAEQKHGTNTNTGIGIGGRSGISDLFGKLRKHSKKMKWTTEEEELLDQKKEKMDLCDTDQQLLEWAMKEVFGESERYERESRVAIEEVTKNGGSSNIELPMLQPPTYPHLLALLMKTFRDKYQDPHLALSMFDYARHLSIPSYVFGCSTAAYNELLETRWRCFRDLKGVHDALEEMSVNGVDSDNGTRKIIETVRREVGERTLWEEDDLGNGDVLSMLDKIEGLAQARASKSKRKGRSDSEKPAKWDDWKTAKHDEGNDEWQFDSWEKPRPRYR